MPLINSYLQAVTIKQCTATAKTTGVQCLHVASIGSDVCKVHGGGKVRRYVQPRDVPNIKKFIAEHAETWAVEYLLEYTTRHQLDLQELTEILYGKQGE